MKHLLLAGFLILTFNAFSQERPVKKLSPEKRHKVADDMIRKGSYYKATEHLHDLVDQHPENTKYIMKLADSYLHSRDYKNAQKWYKRAVDLEKNNSSLAVFRYAEALKHNEQYEEAQKYFEKFAEGRYRRQRGDYDYKKIAQQEIISCEFALKNKNEKAPADIIHIGDHVNSAYSEFAPYLKDDSTLIFSSLQSDDVITVEAEEPHPHTVKLYVSSKDGEEWGHHEKMPQVNTTFENNANGTYSTDKSRFYFTRCLQDHSGEMLCSIFMSKADTSTGKLQKPKKLGSKINREGYSSTQPAIGLAKVGRDTLEVLYFSSNRTRGYGGYDLWYSVIDRKGRHGTAGNLGREINTARDEMTPFFDPVTNSLYFSSNYHPGFGGFDLFKAKGELRKWSKPKNLGKPYNSSADDTYFVIRKNDPSGFIVSNRAGQPEQYHLTSETCCDDIYSFEMKDDLFMLQVNADDQVKYRLVSKKPESSYSFLDSVSHSMKATDSAMVMADSMNVTASADSSVTNESVSDSASLQERILAAKKRKHWEYVRSNISGLRKEKPDQFIEPERYSALDNDKRYFNLEAEREYVIFSTNGKDTAIYFFITDANRQIAKVMTADTSIAGSSVSKSKSINLVSVDIKFPAPDSTATASSTGSEASEVNEKNYTVTKFLEDLKAKRSDRLKVILNYDFDDEKFIEDHAPSLDSLALVMKEFDKIKILITAHTDNLGSDDYNQKLSDRRAESIVTYLVRKGISRNRMMSKGFGETRPLVPNTNPDGSDNEDNRWLNRRAEISIIGGLR